MTNDLTDFNDVQHRISSATAAFQKGIYHLFFLSTPNSHEWYEKVLRIYQCLFQLCLTHLLLDIEGYTLDVKDMQSRLRHLCKNPNLPTRAEIDPAAIITHSKFENKKWPGLKKVHPLYSSSQLALNLYYNTVTARHNLLYRPFMLVNFWEDCTLINLLGSIPTFEEIETAYKIFLAGMIDWHKIECKEMPKRIEVMQKSLPGETSQKMTPICARTFLYDLFMPYRDIVGERPTESLLLTYARMLNPDNDLLLRSIAIYRNSIMDSQNLMEQIGLQSDWRINEFLLK